MTDPQPPGPHPTTPAPAQSGVDMPDVRDVFVPRQRGMQPGGWAGPPWAPPPGPPTGGPPAAWPGPSATGGWPVAGPAGPAYGPPPGGPPPPTAQFPGPGGPAPFPGPGGPPPWGGPGGPPPPGVGPAPRPPRRRGPVIAAVLVVVALVAGGIVAYRTLLSRGGDTPTEAVQLLAADLADEDYLGAVSRLHPAEVDLVRNMDAVLTPELERLGVIEPGAQIQARAGTLTVNGLRFDPAEERVRPNVAIMKLVAGTITVQNDPAAFPFTDEFRAHVFPNGVPSASSPTTIDIADLAARRGEPVRVATVDVDGEWYVSVLYTMADAALQDAGKPWPTTTVAPNGGSDPQDALRQTVQALFGVLGGAGGDVRRLIELAPPGELAVLHDVGDAIPTADNPYAPRLTVTDLQTSETSVDGRTALGVDRIVFESRSPGGRVASVTFARNGDCVSLSRSGYAGASRQEQFCPADLLSGAVGRSASASPEAMRAATAIMKALLDVKFVVVEEGGRWYVSPTRTVVALYASALQGLRPGDLEALLDAAHR